MLPISLKTVGSICSGIEAASVAWKPLGLDFKWFSEIETFPSQLLANHYPDVPNIGDMNYLPDLLRTGEHIAPDIICAGTPCQAFSLAGSRQGLADNRGNLTMKFVEIANTSDSIRKSKGLRSSVLFWENVEGVLSDNTQALGSLLASLTGTDTLLPYKKWPPAGIIHGPLRNVAWRLLDAKYFGIPHQRKRLYLMAGDTDFYPENILFEQGEMPNISDLSETAQSLSFTKDNHTYEFFREYTDCLCASYGRSWNGNAAAFNGSLFVVQDDRLRRFSTLECERLMGFPDVYTVLPHTKRTPRYKALGNSWAVPVVRWLGERLVENLNAPETALTTMTPTAMTDAITYWGFKTPSTVLENGTPYNMSAIPNHPIPFSFAHIVSPDAPKEIYLSPVGCAGILRRAEGTNALLNPTLKGYLQRTASEMSALDIERHSNIYRRSKITNKYDT